MPGSPPVTLKYPFFLRGETQAGVKPEVSDVAGMRVSMFGIFAMCLKIRCPGKKKKKNGGGVPLVHL